MLAATTPPLPVYHLTDRNHCHHICQDESLDNDDNEPGKGGRQSELILKRNSLNSQYVLRSNLMMSAKKGSFEMIAKHKSWKLLLHVIVYSHLRCSTSRDNFSQFYVSTVQMNQEQKQQYKRIAYILDQLFTFQDNDDYSVDVE